MSTNNTSQTPKANKLEEGTLIELIHALLCWKKIHTSCGIKNRTLVKILMKVRFYFFSSSIEQTVKF